MKREYGFYVDFAESVETVSTAVNGLFYPTSAVKDIKSVYRIVCKRDIKGKPGFSTNVYKFFNDVKELDFSICKAENGTRMNCIIRLKSLTLTSLTMLLMILPVSLVVFGTMAISGFSLPMLITWLIFPIVFLCSLFVNYEKQFIKRFKKEILPQIKEYVEVVNNTVRSVQ